MNRRQFLVALGSAAATQSAPGKKLNSQQDTPIQAGAVSLTNGGSKLELLPGPDGYGIALFTSIGGLFSATKRDIHHGLRRSESVKRSHWEWSVRDPFHPAFN